MHSDWLGLRWVAIIIYLWANKEKQIMASCFAPVTEGHILSINEADYLNCVVYTKTTIIIHLSVVESGG